jgi:hypothetical protein
MENLEQPDFKPVYILGAGASKMVGGPLVLDFLTRARELRYSPFLDKQLHEVFDKVFAYQGELKQTKTILGIDLDNLETLFSILDMDYYIESPVKGNHPEFNTLKDIREAFFTLIIETLRQSVVVNENRQAYIDLITGFLVPEVATVITLNYDLAIESALKAANLEPYYGTDRLQGFLNKDSRRIYKLHGSVNWVACTNCKNFGVLKDYTSPVQSIEENAFLHKDNCKERNKFINVILPPTWQKTGYREEIANVWHNSIHELSLATHIVIIGYSFPRTDVFFDQLLTLGLRTSRNLKKVVIINPDVNTEKIVHDFFEKHFVDHKVDFIPVKFEFLFEQVTNKRILNQTHLDILIARIKRRWEEDRIRKNV